MDLYLLAAMGHGQLRPMLARRLNARENTLPVFPGSGVWRTLTRKRAGWTFADPSTGEVAFAGVFARREGGLLPMLVRLKLDKGRVTEQELAYNSGPARFARPEALLEPDILYDAIVPEGRRSGRAELIRIAGLYLDAVTARSGAAVPLSDRCDKYYLGGKVTNTGVGGIGDCRQSFDGITADAPVGRRFPIIDEAKGIVVISFLMPMSSQSPPQVIYECEIIKVVDGKIRSVDEFGNTTAWPPRSGFDP